MVLSYRNLEMLSLQQDEKVADDDIKWIQKKSGEKALKIAFPVFTAIMLIAIVYTLIYEKEFQLFYFLAFVFFGFLSIESLKPQKVYACYGTIIDKTVRCARISGRGSVYLPYEKTEEIGASKHRFTLSETVEEFFYCTVEIDGRIYENVCCLEKDFPKINIGDRVIIANDNSYQCPVVYKCFAKKKNNSFSR